MAIPITVPRLGWNMEEGIFAGWLKDEGDTVQPGETLFTLESDKATEDVECLDAGILHIPSDGPKREDTVSVGTVIGYLLQPGEPKPVSSKNTPITKDPPPPGEGRSIAAPLSAGEVSVKASARESASSGIVAKPVDPSGTVQAAPSAPAVASVPMPSNLSTPRARRAASRLQVDWRNATPTGKNGRVRERDVVSLAQRPNVSESSSRPGSGLPTAQGTVRAEPLSPPQLSSTSAKSSQATIRRIIAQRMMNSLQNTAPVTLVSTFDATRLVALRNRLKAEAPEHTPTYVDFFIKMVAQALEWHPNLHARWVDDRVVAAEGIHIGIAVETEAGLLVPVIRDANRLSLAELTEHTRDLVQRARVGKLTNSEMQGGTFTITSLGSFGIDAFTPIINYPECAILGIGRIHRCPAVVDDQIVIQDQVTLSLTFDHRIVDGAPAARFLQMLGTLLSSIGCN